MSFFELIPSAYAQAAGQSTPGPADMLQSFAPFVIIIGIFYFLMFRPQQQKAKQLKSQLAALRRGDTVVTAGGIYGTVQRVISDNEVTLEIADGVRVRVVRSTITGIVSKTEPAANSDKSDSEPDTDDDATAKPARRRKGAPAAVAASDGDTTG